MRFFCSGLLGFALLAACSAGTGTDGTGGGNGAGGGAADSGMAAATRTLQLALDGDPNGLFWDAAGQTLYIADNRNNRILTWTEAGLGMPIALPAAPPNGPGLGQVTRTGDGTLLTTRFGFGTDGAVLYVKANGDTGTVPMLDTLKRRIGIVTDGDNVYDSYFVVAGSRVGAVAKLTLDGTEVDVMQGLQKPVGLIVLNGVLYAADQMAGEILKCTLPACSDKTQFAALASPDLLSAGPNGSFFSGSPDGNVYELSSAGAVQSVGTFQQPRGTAYDAVNKRLFIADHSGTAGGTNYLRIIPLDG
jgi:DNA-binding beta-propeller fold protein YncE